MARRTSSTEVDESAVVPRLAGALFLAVLVAYGLHALIFDGPAMRAAARQQLAQEIVNEDSAVCERLGMHPGAADFVACSRELAAVRQRQADRDSAAAAGVL